MLHTADDAHGRSIALMKFLSGIAKKLGGQVAEILGDRPQVVG